MSEPTKDADWANIRGLAEWFGFSVPTMRRKLPELYTLGFPKKCNVVAKWYLPACRDWATKLDNLEQTTTTADPFMDALNDSGRH